MPTVGIGDSTTNRSIIMAIRQDDRMLGTIKSSDIGYGHMFGDDKKVWYTFDAIGQIQSRDVGKRVYLRGGIVQVENDSQRTMRLCPQRLQPLADMTDLMDVQKYLEHGHIIKVTVDGNRLSESNEIVLLGNLIQRMRLELGLSAGQTLRVSVSGGKSNG